MRGSNPALNQNTFISLDRTATANMTVRGTINKTGLLALITVASAAWTWNLAGSDLSAAWGLAAIGLLGGLGTALATVWVKRWAPLTAPIYAFLEGLALGCLSRAYDVASHGIAVQAVSLTFLTLAVMLVGYGTGVIRVTQRFRTVVIAATGAIALFYIVALVLGFFQIHIPLLTQGGPLGVLFSLAVVAIAAANLALDFNFIQSGEAAGAPRYMEWYGAFGVMVTLIWLYLEMLRLLTKLRSR